MNDIITIIIKIAAGLLAIVGAYAMVKVKSWLTAKLGAEKTAALERYITEFVAAAEQLYKEEDPDGTKRLKYVTELLGELGYEITDFVRAMIEAKVYDINLAGKTGK